MASDHQYSPSPSRTLGRRATQERVIVELELENEELRKKNEMYRKTVEELRGEIGKLMLKGRSKKQLRQSLHHSDTQLVSYAGNGCSHGSNSYTIGG